jgi:hypothetical protein
MGYEKTAMEWRSGAHWHYPAAPSAIRGKCITSLCCKKSSLTDILKAGPNADEGSETEQDEALSEDLELEQEGTSDEEYQVEHEEVSDEESDTEQEETSDEELDMEQEETSDEEFNMEEEDSEQTPHAEIEVGLDEDTDMEYEEEGMVDTEHEPVFCFDMEQPHDRNANEDTWTDLDVSVGNPSMTHLLNIALAHSGFLDHSSKPRCFSRPRRLCA